MKKPGSVAALILVAALVASAVHGKDGPPEDATLLLITSTELAESWRPFADWKTSLGKRTKIITVDQIAGKFPGRDIQEKIRACVQHHVTQAGTTTVILGGDSAPDGGVVPDRDTDHESMWGKNTGIPTDIYYLSKTNWDADGDENYGEWEDDRTEISYPDGSLGLGRIPVRSTVDVAAYTKKVIAYESRYPEDDFATNMIFTCPVAAAYPKLKRSWDDHIAKAWSNGKARQFFAHTTPWDESADGDFALSPDNWIDLVNRKAVGKFHLHGHGLHHCWVLENHAELDLGGIRRLQNQDAYPVITTVSCFTGQFDSAGDPSIAEQVLRLPDGGAVIVVAPSREGKPHFHDPQKDFPLMLREGKPDGTTLTMARFWSCGLGDNLDAGHAMMTAKSAMAEDARRSSNFHLCLCELNLLGDPTLDLRAVPPRSVKAKFPASIPAKAQSLTITTDAPGARLCLWKKGEIYLTRNCDDKGASKIAITPESPGDLSLTISGPGLNAFSATIKIK